MDVKQFYNDLADWVLTVNKKSQELNEDDYWSYIMTSGGELSKKYDDRPLVRKVLHAHIDYLEDVWKGQKNE